MTHMHRCSLAGDVRLLFTAFRPKKKPARERKKAGATT
jgi:hypothetical protein